MVHALEEIRRVLAPGSTLLDLRPLADRWPVEVLRGTRPLETGRLTDLATGLGDDRASNVAVEEVDAALEVAAQVDRDAVRLLEIERREHPFA